jgi:purine-nucleoside phosphorylase
VKNWSEQGLLAIDMETASTYAMCNELGAKAISILFVSDNMVRKGELMSDRVYRIDRSKTRTKRRELIRDIIFETIEELMITTT